MSSSITEENVSWNLRIDRYKEDTGILTGTGMKLDLTDDVLLYEIFYKWHHNADLFVSSIIYFYLLAIMMLIMLIHVSEYVYVMECRVSFRD